MTNEIPAGDITELRRRCRGAVAVPGDDDYDEHCRGWNLAWTQQPAVVVRAATETDVIHAVRYAAGRGLAVAVLTTGHGVTVPAGPDSLLVVTGDLDRFEVDHRSRTAVIGGGSTWGPVLAAAQEHGLAPLLGSAPHIGVTGYSLGGGFGWLARKHGLAVDSIRSLRVVLADGSVVTTSPTTEPELFWALCGTAGGTLGVVVESTVALVPVTEVYAGNLFYPFDAAAAVFDRYVEWSGRAPEELTSAFNLTAFPPLEAVPEPLRARTFVIVRGCYAGANGAIGTGRDLIDEWRAWREPLMDTWMPMPFARMAEISMDPVEPVPAASSGRWLHRLDDTVLAAMVEAMTADSPSPMLFTETRHGGAAIARDNPSVSYAGRTGDRLLELVGMVPNPATHAILEHRFATVWERVAANLADLAGYLNFAEGTEQLDLVTQAFGTAQRSRLAGAKRRYDPDDVFRCGIPLAVAAA